jgi:hypothetical protein
MGFQVLEERETEDSARSYGPCATLIEKILPAPRFDTCSTLSYIQITGKGKRGLSVHLKRVRLLPEQYPTKIHYPFDLGIFCKTTDLVLASPIPFFVEGKRNREVHISSSDIEPVPDSPLER